MKDSLETRKGWQPAERGREREREREKPHDSQDVSVSHFRLELLFQGIKKPAGKSRGVGAAALLLGPGESGGGPNRRDPKTRAEEEEEGEGE